MIQDFICPNRKNALVLAYAVCCMKKLSTLYTCYNTESGPSSQLTGGPRAR